MRFPLHEDYLISTDPARLDLQVIHGFLSQTYWAKKIPPALVEKMVRHGLCFGVYHQGRQVGFARIISDYTTFAYLSDVFVLPEHRGRGISKSLVETVMAHPDLQHLRRWMLVTRDAQSLYEQFGFTIVPHPDRHMEIVHGDIYEKGFPLGAG